MIEIRTLSGRFQTLGVAVHFLARRPPFAGFTADQLVRTIDGQIERGHCLFAVDGARVVGFLGWALYDRDDALEFARTLRPPDDSRAQGKDVVWVLAAAAIQREAFLMMLGAVRRKYQGRRLMAVRHRPGGRKVLFDRVLQPMP